MSEYYDNISKSTSSFLSRFPPRVRAAAIFAIPFIVADFFNYFSAGTALVFTLPILAIMYFACGWLAAKYAKNEGSIASPAYSGAIAGLLLWAISLAVNTIIGLVLGTITLGATLLLGLPYICICAPIQLLGGGLMGAFGGWLSGKYSQGGPQKPDELTYNDDDYYYQ